ncbi:MAG: glycosyltransferase family 4 protein [Desulfosoma sp.]|uniref:glycosyltransferase family 4 protein n=1 Tax=Desulfosoma sp. TaxID=2603217 RepID=UPI004049F14E
MGGAEHSLLDMLARLRVKSRVLLLSHGPLVERLQATGVDVLIIKGGDGLISLGKETFFPKRLWAAIHIPRIVRQIAAQARWADLVYVNTKKSLLFGILAARLVRRPLLWHQHDPMHVPRTLPLRLCMSETMLVSLLNRYAARLISVSRASADSFIAAGGRGDLPVVIYNGIDPAPYALPVDPIAARRVAGLPMDVPLVGCFARLAECKGQWVVIESLARLPQAHVVFVGGAIYGESGYEVALQREAERLGVAHRVHFLGYRTDVARLMRAVDVLVHPSTDFDSCPRVVLEALHSGTPLVATATGGVPELIEDGVNGLLVPPRDPEALAVSLHRVLTDGALAARLAAAGHQRALSAYNLDRTAREVAAVIDQILAKGKH